MTLIKLNHLLKSTCQRQQGLDYVMLFGSAAKGKLRADSDIDILVGGRLPFAARSELMASLAKQTGRNIDIVMASQANPEVALAAYANGIKILVRNVEQLKKDYFQHYYRYQDTANLRRLKLAKLKRSFCG